MAADTRVVHELFRRHLRALRLGRDPARLAAEVWDRDEGRYTLRGITVTFARRAGGRLVRARVFRMPGWLRLKLSHQVAAEPDYVNESGQLVPYDTPGRG